MNLRRLEQYGAHRGFSLVESLVYLAIFTLVTSAAIGFIFSLSHLFEQYRAQSYLLESSQVVMGRVLTELRIANGIDELNSNFGTSTAGALTLTGDTTTAFEQVGNELRLTLDGSEIGSMTADTVSVDEFLIYRYSTATGELVRVQLTLTATVGDHSKSTTFYGGAVVRGAL